MKYVLWIIQILLAAVYLFAGGFKLFAGAEHMQLPADLPLWFVRFIGLCELLGAFGMILPGVFRYKVFLTPLAAAGFVIIMIGATIITAVAISPSEAWLPALLGVLAAFVAYGRWKLVPLSDRGWSRSFLA